MSEDTPIKDLPSPDQPVVPPAQAESPREKEPVYKRWWFWVAIIVVMLLAALVGLGDQETEGAEERIAADMSAEAAPDPEPEPAPSPSPQPEREGRSEGEGLASNELRVSRDEFGDAWPFKVDEGVIACEGLEYTFTADGRTYALNGIAIQAGYPEIDEIWLDDPDIPGAKISLSPFNRLASELCD